jgi:hypothetical protein
MIPEQSGRLWENIYSSIALYVGEFTEDYASQRQDRKKKI